MGTQPCQLAEEPGADRKKKSGWLQLRPDFSDAIGPDGRPITNRLVTGDVK
jgi:hypothetical protein